jgi:hypothetical protein
VSAWLHAELVEVQPRHFLVERATHNLGRLALPLDLHPEATDHPYRPCSNFWRHEP